MDAAGCPVVACEQITSFTASFTGGNQIDLHVASTLPAETVLTIDNNGLHSYLVLDAQGAGHLTLARVELVHTISILECPGRSVVLDDGAAVACWQISDLEVSCDASQPGSPRLKVAVHSTLAQGVSLTLDVNGQQQAVTADCRGSASAEFLVPGDVQTVRIVQCPGIVRTLACSAGPPADFDFDLDVDLDDLTALESCARGPTLRVEGDCQQKDLDRDGDVDQDDFGLFQRSFSVR